jgi:hypothetical protein
MKDELQDIELAKLDKWCFPSDTATTINASCIATRGGLGHYEGLHSLSELNYRTSYDAIIPLIMKLDKSEGLSFRVLFLNALRAILQRDLGKNAISDFEMLTATPAQLCEALLRAHNLWKDE